MRAVSLRATSSGANRDHSSLLIALAVAASSAASLYSSGE